jgi:cytochrome c553
MKKTAAIALFSASLFALGAAQAGDPVAGKQKATACIVCHGSETTGGLFFTLQLAGRDADKLTVKTNKYKTGKIFHPMMNLATAFFTEKEIEDISAYYKTLGKPAFVSPLFKIQGDDEVKTMAEAAAPAQPAQAVPSAKVAASY